MAYSCAEKSDRRGLSLGLQILGGWEVLTQTAHSGERRSLRPFAMRDTITIAFRKYLPIIIGDRTLTVVCPATQRIG
jgi:hypothetical protein